MTFEPGQIVECVIPEAELKLGFYFVERCFKRHLGFEQVYVLDLFTRERISTHGWVVERFKAATVGK